MSKKICIAVVDSIDANTFRVEVPATYTPKVKKTEEEKKTEARATFNRGYGWPPADDEDFVLCNFDKIAKRIGKKDEFNIGYLALPDDIGNPFFNNPETQKLFTKHNPRVINREDYQKLIDSMRKMIADQYYEILQNRHNWQGVLESKMEMWESQYDFPYNLDNNTNSITNVYAAEVQIWDLIRMYKAIDWMRDTVVLYC